MKKKLIVLAVMGLALLPLATQAGNPTVFGKARTIDTMTVDSQYTGTWESGGTLIVATSDTGKVVLTITGRVYLAPFERLYVGFADSAAGKPNLGDTLIYQPDVATRNPLYAPIVFEDVVTKNGAVTDTFYVYFASGSNTTKIKLDGLIFRALVLYDEL